MKMLVKMSMAIAFGSAMLLGAVTAASAQTYRAPSGYYMAASPYAVRSAEAYRAYGYSGPARRYGEFGSYELGFNGCASDGNYGRTDYNSC